VGASGAVAQAARRSGKARRTGAWDWTPEQQRLPLVAGARRCPVSGGG
jgi:hypothetical protein